MSTENTSPEDTKDEKKAPLEKSRRRLTPEQVKRLERSRFHLSELAVRVTRKASDRVEKEVIPSLVEKLTSGSFTLEDLMTINDAYFGDQEDQPGQAGLAGSLGKRSFLSEQTTDGSLDITSLLGSDMPKGIHGMRAVNVSAGDIFIHPNFRDSEDLGNTVVYRLNRFIERCEEFDDEQLRKIILKFYLIFSTLHLPLDGSGRFTGDVDTLIQRAVQKKLKEAGRGFPLQRISISGYRLGSGESWAQREAQMTFRAFLLEDVIRSIAEGSGGTAYGYNSGSFKVVRNSPKEQREHMRSIAESIYEKEGFYKDYKKQLHFFLHRITANILEPDNDSKLDSLLQDVQEKKPQGPDREKYHTFSLEETLVLDILAGFTRSKSKESYNQLAIAFSSPSVVNPDWLNSSPALRDLLMKIMTTMTTISESEYKTFFDDTMTRGYSDYGTEGNPELYKSYQSLLENPDQPYEDLSSVLS